MPLSHLYLATGADYADALAIGPTVAAQPGNALLLIDPDLPFADSNAEDFYRLHRNPGWDSMTRVGGPGAITDDLFDSHITSVGNKPLP